MPESQKNTFSKNLTRLKELSLLAVLLLGVGLLFWNLGAVNEFVKRVLRESHEVSIGQIVKVSLKESSGDLGPEGGWITYYRVGNKLRVESAVLTKMKKEDKDSEREYGEEYLELRALTSVNLTKGYIGDQKRLLYLGDREILVEPEQVIRIYTHLGENLNKETVRSEVWETLKRDVVFAESLTEKREKGIYKADPGEGDRIVIASHDGQILLDMDYWWKPDTK